MKGKSIKEELIKFAESLDDDLDFELSIEKPIEEVDCDFGYKRFKNTGEIIINLKTLFNR